MATSSKCPGGNYKEAMSLSSCADTCKGKSSMFALATFEFGEYRHCWGGFLGIGSGCHPYRCRDGGCECVCEVDARKDGTCEHKEEKGYNLYRYQQKGM